MITFFIIILIIGLLILSFWTSDFLIWTYVIDVVVDLISAFDFSDSDD